MDAAGLTLRVAMALAAVALAVVLAPALGAARDEAEGLRIAREELSPARVPEIEGLLRRSAERTPSSAPDIALAQLYLFAGRTGEATRILERVARREPANREAWRLIAQAHAKDDPRAADAARRRALALSPPVPDPKP